jgi:hypothetical protein
MTIPDGLDRGLKLLVMGYNPENSEVLRQTVLFIDDHIARGLMQILASNAIMKMTEKFASIQEFNNDMMTQNHQAIFGEENGQSDPGQVPD